MVKEEEGVMGQAFKTDVIMDLNYQETGKFDTNFETEYWASYYQIETERLHIEIWSFNRWTLNWFASLTSIPLMDVASGTQEREIHMVNLTD